MITRRAVLRGSTALLLASLGGGQSLRIACAETASGRIVVNLMLIGGADLRQLFVPHPDAQPDYAAAFWKARARMTGQRDDIATYRSLFNSQYTAVSMGATTFGVHNGAGWLTSRLNDGGAAIVANVVGSANRSHTHSQLIWRTGDPRASEYDYDRDGWGGRLAHVLTEANVVSVSPSPSVFAQGPAANDRNARAIQAPEPRQFALDETTAGPFGGLVATALTDYYAAKQLDAVGLPVNSPFHRILAHERRLRALGRELNASLARAAPQRPEPLRLLYQGPVGTGLADAAFGLQCAALFDCIVAGAALNMRVGYMEHGNWDTHVNQPSRMATNIADVFGAGKGLATLTQELARHGAARNVVFVITSDFGRQIVANTQGGTDHGSGSYSIVIGDAVRGAIFGEMFPVREITGAPGARPLDTPGAEILGLTSFERVLGEICDWVAAGSGNVVFPGRATSALEAGVELKAMFG